jgi:hypothetical protein
MCIDLLVGRDLEANNRTAAIAVQRREKHASTMMKLLFSKHVPAATVMHAMGETGCRLHVLR